VRNRRYTRIEKVRVGDIGWDRRVNTRPVDTTWVRNHLQSYDPAALGTPELSRRDDGTLIFIDGQHRGALTVDARGLDTVIECKVHYGLNVQEEAARFRLLNDGRSVKNIYEFIGRITEEEPMATRINEIVRSWGWEITDQSRDGAIQAVEALEQVYTAKRRAVGLDPDAALHTTLGIITETWAWEKDSANQNVIKGIGMVVNCFGKDFEPSAMVAKLKRHTAADLIRRGRQFKEDWGGSVAHGTAVIVVNWFNSGKKKNVLPTDL
jgi:hypothetical protein